MARQMVSIHHVCRSHRHIQDGVQLLYTHTWITILRERSLQILKTQTG